MPRYLVERTFDQMSDEEMQALVLESKRSALEHFPEVRWDHSHVVVDEAGAVRSYCVYEAPDEQQLLAHASGLGGHVIDRIYEIVDDIDPDALRI